MLGQHDLSNMKCWVLLSRFCSIFRTTATDLVSTEKSYQMSHQNTSRQPNLSSSILLCIINDIVRKVWFKIEERSKRVTFSLAFGYFLYDFACCDCLIDSSTEFHKKNDT